VCAGAFSQQSVGALAWRVRRVFVDGSGYSYPAGPGAKADRRPVRVPRRCRRRRARERQNRTGRHSETLGATGTPQALNAARVQYLQHVIEFNRSQSRLYAAIGQPALCGAPEPQSVAVPVVPSAPGPALPAPRPVP
jgi:hypothetical protein